MLAGGCAPSLGVPELARATGNAAVSHRNSLGSTAWQQYQRTSPVRGVRTGSVTHEGHAYGRLRDATSEPLTPRAARPFEFESRLRYRDSPFGISVTAFPRAQARGRPRWRAVKVDTIRRMLPLVLARLVEIPIMLVAAVRRRVAFDLLGLPGIR